MFVKVKNLIYFLRSLSLTHFLLIGLTLNVVEYFDQNRWRSILYRAAIGAYDVGEAGMGILTNCLVRGCDCLGEIRYLDAVVNNNQGQALLLKNAICIHEEDIGILWKHTE